MSAENQVTWSSLAEEFGFSFYAVTTVISQLKRSYANFTQFMTYFWNETFSPSYKTNYNEAGGKKLLELARKIFDNREALHVSDLLDDGSADTLPETSLRAVLQQFQEATREEIYQAERTIGTYRWLDSIAENAEYSEGDEWPEGGSEGPRK